VRRAISNPARQAPFAFAWLTCVASVVFVACSSSAPSVSDVARPDASVTPIWTAPPPGLATRPAATPVPTASAVVDAATAIELTGMYHLVYRPNDTSLTDTFTAGLGTSGLKPRVASREVWDASQQVGGMLVIDFLGMDLPDDALTTFATTFAGQATADLTWATIGGQRVAVVSQGEQRLELFLLGGDLIVVAGIQSDVGDDIALALIQQNP